MSTFQTTNAEAIGAGHLWTGVGDPSLDSDAPAPFQRGSAMGQHLRVRRLARVTEGKHLYVVDNLGPKWSRRKCWACGHKYSPNRAKTCVYCATPLRDLQFLMTARWDARRFAGFEAFARLRLRHLGLIAPVAVLYRGGQQMAVYHYNGEGLLIDEPSPLPGDVVLAIGIRLAETLGFLHARGVVLAPFDAGNVVIMPDGSVRWFDLDVERVLGPRESIWRQPGDPVLQDTRRLGALLRRFVAVDDPELAGFLDRVADGEYPNPYAFTDTATRLLAPRRDQPFAPAAWAYTDVGLTRAHNEDAWGWQQLTDKAALYVVADGMGGHDRGEVASALAVQTLLSTVTRGARAGKADPAALEKLLRAGMDAANHAVLAHAGRHRISMGTAVVAALQADPKTVYVAHAGDCRAYLLREGVLRRLTRDHTVASELLADGRITEEQARVHPRANVLTVVVGGEEELDFDLVKVPVQRGDRLLLCSDGLWNDLADDELATYLQGYADCRTVIQMLVRTVYERKGADNLTLQIVDVA